MLECVVCGSEFERKGSRGPIPKYCSPECGREPHKDRKREYDKNRTLTPKQLFHKTLYGFKYSQRPEVKEKNRLRMRKQWWENTEYRERQLERFKKMARKKYVPQTPLPAPYTGHRWLDMAASVVGRQFDPTAPWADDYWDDMGEAVLALLEGRDMKEAVKKYRSKEYVYRRLNIHLGDWGDDEERQNRWFESLMPKTESAEEEALANEAVVFYPATRFKNVSTKNRHMKNKTGTPSNRRSNHR